MRRSINQDILVTKWPPSDDFGKFNRQRFKTWVHYMMVTHNVTPAAFTNTSQQHYISHDTFKSMMNCTRDLTPVTVRKVIRIFAKYTDRRQDSIKREAYENIKPYSKDVKDPNNN